MCKNSCFCRNVQRFLRLASLGKYRQGLYYRGYSAYSSIYGGILSIIIAIILLAISIIILIPVIEGSNVDSRTEIKDTAKTNYQIIDLERFNDNFQYYQIIVKSKIGETYDYDAACANITLVMTTSTTVIGPFKFAYDGDFSDSLHSCLFRQATDEEYHLQSYNLKDPFTYDGDLSFNYYPVTFNISNANEPSKLNITTLIVGFDVKKHSVDGVANLTSLITLDKTTSTLKLTLLDLNQTIDKLFPTFEEAFFISGMTEFLSYSQDEQRGFYFDVILDYTVEYLELKPYNWITPLSKIGGMLAFVRIFTFFLSFIHQLRFEHILNKDLKASKIPPLNERQHIINDTVGVHDLQTESEFQDKTSLIGKKEEKFQKIHEVYSYSNFKAMIKKQKEQDEINHELMQMLLSQEKTIKSLKQQVEMMKESGDHDKQE